LVGIFGKSTQARQEPVIFGIELAHFIVRDDPNSSDRFTAYVGLKALPQSAALFSGHMCSAAPGAS
jgi:hypothetical protein